MSGLQQPSQHIISEIININLIIFYELIFSINHINDFIEETKITSTDFKEILINEYHYDSYIIENLMIILDDSIIII